MKGKVGFLGGVLALVLSMGLILSCENPSSSTSYGTIGLSVSTLSGLLGIDTTASAGKAVVIADSVKLSLYSDSTLVDSTTVTPTQTSQTAASVSWEVPVGTDYTLSVEVFNTAVSSEEPTVEGTSDSFDVTAGETTSVEVTCLPVSASALTVGGSAAEFSLAELGEKWFSFSSGTDQYIDINVATVGDDDEYGIAVSTVEGYFCYAAILTGDKTFTLSTSAIASYNESGDKGGYIAILAENANTFNVSLSAGSAPTDDGFEENDSFSSLASGLGENTTYTLYGGDKDVFAISLAAGDTITATMTVDDWYDSPLAQLRLYNASQERLAKATLSADETSETGTATLSYTISTAGTYYLRTQYTSCNQVYYLKWTTSASSETGTVSVWVD